MDDTKHAWTVAKPGFGKVAATIPIIYDANGHAVAHVLGGQDKAQLIVQAVNAYASNQAQIAALREALEEVSNSISCKGISPYGDACGVTFTCNNCRAANKARAALANVAADFRE